MSRPMKRFAPYVLFVAGLLTLCIVMPYFNAAQPRGVRVTRPQATAIADAAARQIGVPVDRAWSNIVWDGSDHFAKQLENDSDLRRRAEDDPVIGPRLGYYDVAYFRRGSDKWTPY